MKRKRKRRKHRLGLGSLFLNFGHWGVRFWLEGGDLPPPYKNSWALLYQKDRQGPERVLRGEHITEDSTWWGGSPSAQVFLRLPLLALEGRLHHLNSSGVAGFSVSNSCSLEQQTLAPSVNRDGALMFSSCHD